MEQVFDLVNAVLRRDRETEKRNLSIRGYKVIPLAPQAGVLEFVGNTLPLSHWISRGHTKYVSRALYIKHGAQHAATDTTKAT